MIKLLLVGSQLLIVTKCIDCLHPELSGEKCFQGTHDLNKDSNAVSPFALADPADLPSIRSY